MTLLKYNLYEDQIYIFKITSQNKNILSMHWNHLLVRRCTYLAYSAVPKTEPFPALSPSLQKWQEEITSSRDEVEEVGARAQEILDERHVSSRLGCQATQLTSRYQALLLQVLVSGPPLPLQASTLPKLEHPSFLSLPFMKALTWVFNLLFNFVFVFFFPKEQIKFLEEEIQSLEEAELSLSCYSDWYSSTHKNFKNVAAKIDKVDKAMMGKKMKTLEVGMATSGLSPNLSSFTDLLHPPARLLGGAGSSPPGMMWGPWLVTAPQILMVLMVLTQISGNTAEDGRNTKSLLKSLVWKSSID